MLEAITNKIEISKCQRILESILKRSLPHQELLIIGYSGGNFENPVHYGDDLWYSTKILKRNDVSIPRYFNGFGAGKREGGHQIITVEINPPIEGFTKQVSGLFAKDKRTNTYFLLHSGRIGGGKKGVGKKAFESWFRGTWIDVLDGKGDTEKYILIGQLNSNELTNHIREFVAEVAKFKSEVKSGTLSRRPTEKNKILTFDPEFYGKKTGKRRATFEYESYHGLVVSELEKKYKNKHGTKKYTIFNTNLIDLGLQVNGKTQHIFEVKSLSDRQSIYAGIGQLMFHSLGSVSVKKTLVLPSGESSKKLIEVLNQLGIDLLFYKINNGEVKFTT